MFVVSLLSFLENKTTNQIEANASSGTTYVFVVLLYACRYFCKAFWMYFCDHNENIFSLSSASTKLLDLFYQVVYLNCIFAGVVFLCNIHRYQLCQAFYQYWASISIFGHLLTSGSVGIVELFRLSCVW